MINDPPLNINGGSNNTIFPQPLRNRYRTTTSVRIYSTPKIANDVPFELKKVFPNQDFYIPDSQPGIYVLFFPHNKSVYVGRQAKA